MSEKTCDRCGQPIKEGEGYAETDIGIGKWVHWPSCPAKKETITVRRVKCPRCGSEELKLKPKVIIREGKAYVTKEITVCAKCGYEFPTSPSPEKPDKLLLPYKLWRLWFTTPRGFEAFFWTEAKTREDAEETAKKWVPEGSELRFATSYNEKEIKELLRDFSRGELEAITKGTPCAVEAYLRTFHTEKVPPIVARVAENMLAGKNPDGTPVSPGRAIGLRSNGEAFLVDGLTMKDYYDLRDLRLLLWGLEKELVGKYGIIEAEPLASKVRDLIKKKIEQVTSKIGSSSEISPEVRWRLTEEVWSVLRDMFEDWCERVGGKFEAFGSGFGTQIMEDHLICKLGKGAVELEIHAEDDVRLILVDYPGFPDTTIEKELGHGRVPIERLRQKLLKGEKLERTGHHHSAEKQINRGAVEAEIDVLIDNLADAIRKGGDIPAYLRDALRKSFMYFKENPHSPVSSGNPIEKFDVKYIDLTTNKTVETTIPAREQVDLYKRQREGKINIISIHPSASSTD